jgi:hypothetical protein
LTEIEGPVFFEARALELEHGDCAGDRHALVLGREVRLPLPLLVLLPPDIVDEEPRNVPSLVALLLEKVGGSPPLLRNKNPRRTTPVVKSKSSGNMFK